MEINEIAPDKHKYLQGLADIAKPPKTLYYSGTLPTERPPTVAIVGTRKPTAYGKEIAHTFAYELAKRGVVIVSGLAFGIDSIAHRAALEANGTTIAVLANGLSHIYPSSHTRLGAQIIQSGGAILSEYEPAVKARSFQFLERNRLVSGIADATLVVEAAARSGTLNTAAHTLEQGRELFVVPGNITSPLSAGCNSMLAQGAHPALTFQTILDIIAPQLTAEQTSLPLGDTPLEAEIIKLLHSGLRDGEQLQQATQAHSAEFSHALTMLELAGIIRPLGSNQWSLG